MRFVATAVIAAGLTLPAIAQTEAQAPAKPADPPQAAPVDAESVKKAESVMRESAKAYAAAKALSDIITMTAKTPEGDQKQQMHVWFQGSDAAQVGLEEMTFTAVDKNLYAERTGIADRYAQFAVDSDIAGALESELGFVPPQIVARSTDDVQRLVNAFTFQMLPMATVAGHAMAKMESGEDVHEIKLSSPAGEGAIHINTKSMLVQTVIMRMKMEGAPEMVFTLGYEPKVSDTLTPAIAFDPGTRQKVSSVDDLKIDLTGKPAPDFILEALDGSKVTLSELKGNVVILDFWATWCGPCKMALPKLNEFAQWAKDSNAKVKVFGVDVWERTKPEETRKAVSEFWTKNAYIMPTLFDLDSAVAKKFGFDAIPTTIVIGPDGNVFTVHTGYNEDMVAELKKNVEEAMKGVK